MTQPGDLWILGNHRLLCGDSSSPADLDRLLGGAAVHLCNTDPPYNVSVSPRSNNAIAAGLSTFSNDPASSKLKQGQGNAASFGIDHETGKPKNAATHKKLRAKDRPLANDFVSEEEFDRLLDAWFGNIARVLVPGGSFYIWGGYYVGASAKAWYLFANPNVLPAFEIVFLYGRRTPVVEQVETPPNKLGISFRSYLDVGVREQDHRAVVKSKGEA